MVNIKIENLDFAYNGSLVLNKIFDEIKKGEFTALVGPNGSGKSTLLRCLDKILLPKNGSIYLNGKNFKEIDRKILAKSIAYVPQSEDEVFQSNVFDTILMGRKPHISWMPTNDDLEITAKVIEKLDLSEFSMKYLNQLSGGQRQRVYIARALAQQPKILFLDEPTANLDLRHQLEVLDILKNLTKKGISVVVAIHDLNLALQFCEKIVMLKDGKIFAKGGKEIITSKIVENLYGVKVKIINEDERFFIIPEKTQ
ncbi:MAG: ABC transporter ATP-binding protein [Bacteroidales bacterium]|nr:ABC transporter ATP-binding protein [Bacteroidales bacterium]